MCWAPAEPDVREEESCGAHARPPLFPHYFPVSLEWKASSRDGLFGGMLLQDRRCRALSKDRIPP